MVTRRHAPARSVALFAFVVLANTLGAACTKEDPPNESAIALPTRTSAADASAESAAPRIEIGGLLVDDLDEPVIGRPIDIVDASGQRFSLITDEGGGFWALGALAPYDVLVAPAPSGAVITPMAYLGLTRRDPRLEVFEHDGPLMRPASQLLRVSVTLPPCRAPSGTCFVSVVSASATGRGGTAASYGGPSSTTVFALEHAFEKAALAPAESVNVHVLVGDAETTEFAYAAVIDLPASPGAETDVALAPAPIASSAPVSIAARSAGVPLGWDWTLASELELLDGAVMTLRYDWSSSSSLRLPLLLGASWRVNAWAQAPRDDEDDDDNLPRRSSQARSGTLPVPAANVALDLPTPPLPIALSGTSIAWRGEPSLASVIVIDDVRGAQRFRAFTSEASIPLSRLTAMGLSPLQAGAHTLDLQTTAGADVDSLTEPDDRVRAQRFGLDRPGGATYQRARFMVSP